MLVAYFLSRYSIKNFAILIAFEIVVLGFLVDLRVLSLLFDS